MIEPQQSIELTIQYRNLTDDFQICVMYGEIVISIEDIDMNEFRRKGSYHMICKPQQ